MGMERLWMNNGAIKMEKKGDEYYYQIIVCC